MVGGDRQEEEEAHDETIPRRRADHDNGAVGITAEEEEDADGSSSSVGLMLADNIMVGVVVVANERTVVCPYCGSLTILLYMSAMPVVADCLPFYVFFIGYRSRPTLSTVLLTVLLFL